MSEIIDVEFVNADPRCACMLLLDTSLSMQGLKIKALNEGLKAFEKDLQGDVLAKRRVEVGIVTFGGVVNSIQDFVTADRFVAPTLSASGETPMGEAIQTGLDLIRERKETYKRNGVLYYRPWVVMITDGEPTDHSKIPSAAARIRHEEEENRVAFFAIGTEQADMEVLSHISVRQPLTLAGMRFVDLFLWLSRSQKDVGRSIPGQMLALPAPQGWSKVKV